MVVSFQPINVCSATTATCTKHRHLVGQIELKAFYQFRTPPPTSLPPPSPPTFLSRPPSSHFTPPSPPTFTQLSEVDNFVAIVNGTLQSQEEVGKVKDVMNQIDGYSAVTSAGEMERVSAHTAPGVGCQQHTL